MFIKVLQLKKINHWWGISIFDKWYVYMYNECGGVYFTTHYPHTEN